MLQPAEADRRAADHAAAGVTAIGYPAGSIDLDPGPQHVAEPEPVGGAELLKIAKLGRGRIVVVGESCIERQPGSALDRL